jgi:hypothetical protein
MSNLFKSKSQQTSSQSYDPRVYGESLQNLQLAEQVAAMPFQAYRGPMVAPFTRDYMQGEAMTRGIASQGGYVPEIEQASRASQAALGFQPAAVQAERIKTQFEAPTAQAAQFTDASLGQYMNPYQQGVIDVGLQDISRQDELARQQRAQRAASARAFGGSRAAIQEGIAAGEAARERNRFLAEQRSQGFQQAAQLRESDVNRQQQIALANQQARQQAQQMGMTAEQFNAQQAMQGGLANQQAGLQGAQFRLGAASQLGDLGQRALQNRYGAAQAMTGLGQAQQQLAQQMMNAQREEFMRRQQYPLQQLAIRQGAVSGALVNQQGSTTSTQRGSPLQIAGQIGSTAMGLGWQGFGSDMRMKTGVSKIKNPLDKVNRLKGIEFEWEDGYGSEEGEDEGGERDMSVSAQDVEKVMPSAISRRKSDNMRQVDAAQMIGLLTEAVKELDAKVSKKVRK